MISHFKKNRLSNDFYKYRRELNVQNAYLLTLKLKASNHSYLTYNSLCNFPLSIKCLTVSKFCFSYVKGICFSLLARENFFAHNSAFGYTENLHSYLLNGSLLILYEFALPT